MESVSLIPFPQRGKTGIVLLLLTHAFSTTVKGKAKQTEEEDEEAELEKLRAEMAMG
jgi:hypothetical protein